MHYYWILFEDFKNYFFNNKVLFKKNWFIIKKKNLDSNISNIRCFKLHKNLVNNSQQCVYIDLASARVGSSSTNLTWSQADDPS